TLDGRRQVVFRFKEARERKSKEKNVNERDRREVSLVLSVTRGQLSRLPLFCQIRRGAEEADDLLTKKEAGLFFTPHA
ncbi:GATA transcription factor 17, partial [Clarias magur]